MNSKMISAVIEKKSNLNDVEIRLSHVSKVWELIQNRLEADSS